jgi:hypothetical protein
LALLNTDELYKAVKLGANGDVKNKGKVVAVEDEEEDSELAGPELPPDFNEEDVADDEEGRFFGSGMDQNTVQAMEYLDQQEKDNGNAAVRFGTKLPHESEFLAVEVDRYAARKV